MNDFPVYSVIAQSVGALADNDTCDGEKDGSLRSEFGSDKKSLKYQLAISIVFGLTAFLIFCLLRPRWTTLYSARKKRKSQAAILPQLPKTFFGWIPVVYRISDEDVLASAGLDAFAFLRFFRMAIKYTAFLFFFALSVIFPVIKVFEPDGKDECKKGKGGDNSTEDLELKYGSPVGLAGLDLARSSLTPLGQASGNHSGDPDDWWSKLPAWTRDDSTTKYMWTHFVFVYFFSAVGIWLIITETQKIIKIRQKYLAAQSSVSDRTIRLSGIPTELRTEAKIKEIIENLEIGKVESVTLCRNWTELDELAEEREVVLQHLEGAWTDYLGERKSSRKMKRRYAGDRDGQSGDEEQAGLLSGDDMDDGAHVLAVNRPRPEKRLWYGFMNLQSRKVDAIDYYEEKLRRLDERMKAARKKEYPAMPLAFVTLDSAAACQMACQAIIDPQPMQLMANPSPSPSGVVWKNTYLSRKTRMLRAWTITVFVLILTVFWLFLLLPLATLLTPTNIRSVFPGLAKFLSQHETLETLVTSLLPTLLVAILNVAVPYFYEYLSSMQGMTSLADIETSLISKNFFFIFFNLFVALTVLGTGATAAALFKDIGAHLRDVALLATSLALSLPKMSNFYMNYIVLQTFGLFPFRLLQFGSVSLYPWYWWRAKTPRDFNQLTQPGVFTYGFFIPQTLFIFIICIAYSVMKHTETIQAFGLCYFLIGSFIYKYQLLYSMDHRQFSTGRAWPMMCIRFLCGLVVFQLIVAGQLAGRRAILRSAFVGPLILATVWFTFWYRRTYEPLMKNIALRTLREVHDEAEARMAESIMSGEFSGADEESNQQRFRWPDLGLGAANGRNGHHDSSTSAFDYGARTDGEGGTRSRYVNPNLIKPLEEPWIPRAEEREAEINGSSSRSALNAEDEDDD